MAKYKMLIIAPAWVGDLVMSQTLLKLLQQKFQGNLAIDIFANKFLHPILLRMPEVTNIMENPFQHKSLQLIQRIKLSFHLRKNKYDEVIVLPNSLKSALTPFFAVIKKRTGFIGESRYILLNNYYKLDKIYLPLMVDRFCALGNDGIKVENISFPRLQVNMENQNLLLNKFNLSQDKALIAFCPAAEYGPAKRWPPEYFARLADLIPEDKYQILILGSKKDLALSNEIIGKTHKKIINCCGETNLADAVDILAMAKYTVTNDSGLMHIACAVNSKVLAIYGSTSTNFTPPLNSTAEIIKIDLECSPCFQRTCKFGHYNCLKQISPAMLLSKIST